MPSSAFNPSTWCNGAATGKIAEFALSDGLLRGFPAGKASSSVADARLPETSLSATE